MNDYIQLRNELLHTYEGCTSSYVKQLDRNLVKTKIFNEDFYMDLPIVVTRVLDDLKYEYRYHAWFEEAWEKYRKHVLNAGLGGEIKMPGYIFNSYIEKYNKELKKEMFHSVFRSEDTIESYLKHHGIKGQKWGVRRYQNEDGTLTDEGKKRYGLTGDYGADKVIMSEHVLKKGFYNNDFRNDIKKEISKVCDEKLDEITDEEIDNWIYSIDERFVDEYAEKLSKYDSKFSEMNEIYKNMKKNNSYNEKKSKFLNEKISDEDMKNLENDYKSKFTESAFKQIRKNNKDFEEDIKRHAKFDKDNYVLNADFNKLDDKTLKEILNKYFKDSYLGDKLSEYDDEFRNQFVMYNTYENKYRSEKYIEESKKMSKFNKRNNIFLGAVLVADALIVTAAIVASKKNK